MPKILKVPGFEFAGIACGIKGRETPDLALIRSTVPAVTVGLFTNNRVQAAPVVISERNIRSALCSAVIINSGNANACTGKRGLKNAQRMVEATAQGLHVPVRHVLVCSTGKIGIPMPIAKISQGIPRLIRSLNEADLLAAARAILTTDHGVKTASARFRVGGREIHLVGFAKGAGMIEPHLQPHATMLAFFLTDLKIGRGAAATIFRRCADLTFNRISVDGDTSTNDTALLLANGLAGNRPVVAGSREARIFGAVLGRVMEKLALMMVADGEGATKLVRLEVRGARNEAEARKVAYAIGNSPLVKTSFYGGDPNWGRLIAAAGRSGATLDPQAVDIYYEGVCVARRGVSTGRPPDRKAKKAIKKRSLNVLIDLPRGGGTSWIWTSDLSLDYVKLNSCYRT